MMPEENVELVRRAEEAWNTGGIDDLLPFYPEDVVWYPFPDAPGWADGLHGHNGIREIMAGWSESFDDYRISTTEIRDLGGVIVSLGEISGTIKGSDAPMRQPIGVVASDFRDGKIGCARFFPTWQEALDAAGL